MKFSTQSYVITFFLIWSFNTFSEETKLNFSDQCKSIGGEVKENLCQCQRKINPFVWHKAGRLRFPYFQTCRKNLKRILLKEKKENSKAQVHLKALDTLESFNEIFEALDPRIKKKAKIILSHIPFPEDLETFYKILFLWKIQKVSQEKLDLFLQFSLIFPEKKHVSLISFIKLFEYFDLNKFDKEKYEILSRVFKKPPHVKLINNELFKKVENWNLSDPKRKILASRSLRASYYQYDAFILFDAFSSQTQENYTKEDLEAYKEYKDTAYKTSNPKRVLQEIKTARLKKEEDYPKFLRKYLKLGFPELSAKERKKLLEIFPDLTFSDKDYFLIKFLKQTHLNDPSPNKENFKNGLKYYFSLYSLISKSSILSEDHKAFLRLFFRELIEAKIPTSSMNTFLEENLNYLKQLTNENEQSYLEEVLYEEEEKGLFFINFYRFHDVREVLSGQLYPLMYTMFENTLTLTEKMNFLVQMNQLKKSRLKFFTSRKLLKHKNILNKMNPFAFVYFINHLNPSYLKRKGFKYFLERSSLLELKESELPFILEKKYLKQGENSYEVSCAFKASTKRVFEASYFYQDKINHKLSAAENKKRKNQKNALELGKLKSYLEEAKKQITVLKKL